MSDNAEQPSVDGRRTELAEIFNRDLDPLVDYAGKFQQSGIDPFELFDEEILRSHDYAAGTRTSYRRIIDQWRSHMFREGRHPACPSEQHVRSFLEYYLKEQENQPDTVKTKLQRLNTVYEYWQNDTAFPHPHDFNPFVAVLSKVDLSRPETKDPPRISIPELGSIIGDIVHIRDRAVIATQLKFGLRASELCNLQIQDINLEGAKLKQAYPELATHSAIADRSSTVYIAPRDERDGNKSWNPRVLPLDEELEQLLRRYLLIRPDTGDPWLFLSQNTHSKSGPEYMNELWVDVFRPEYAETEEHRALTSHFGRHRFTTYWRVEQDLNRELVKYMRGDTPRDGKHRNREAIDRYLHTYYEDIEHIYRENIFQLGLNGEDGA